MVNALLEELGPYIYQMAYVRFRDVAGLVECQTQAAPKVELHLVVNRGVILVPCGS